MVAGMFCAPSFFSGSGGTLAGGGGGGEAKTASTAQTETLTSTTGTTTSEAKYTPLAGNEVGLGISDLSYYDSSFSMADVVRQSQFRNPSDWGTNVGADAQGAPSQDFLMIFSARVIGSGTYKLQFRGQADITVAATPSGSIVNKTYDKTTNTTTADVVLPQDSKGNTWLSFKNTRRTAQSASADGVTDIHMWRPGYATDGSAVFTKEFITAMKRVHVIRGMDFLMANRNGTQSWGERTRMDHLGPADTKGQPWELIVLLANATGTDVWINVPVKADDDYIRKLALLFKYGSDGTEPYTSTQAKPTYPPLNPNIKVYVEYGNEIWNSGPGFYGFSWALALSDAARAQTNPVHPINIDGLATSDNYLGLRRWIAYRSATISQTFRQVFGDQAMMSHIRPILASQVGNGNLYLSKGLIWAQGYYKDTAAIWYGGGGAAYYDSTTAPTDTQSTTMQAYFDGLPSPQFAQNTTTDAIWTKGYGLKTIAYEGGPGPGGSSLGTSTGSAQLSATYNNDPRMKDRMIAAHQIWQANGGDLLTYYTYSGPAPWAFNNMLAFSTTTEIDTTKMTALEAIRTMPTVAPTIGIAAPSSIDLRANSALLRWNLPNDGPWKYNSTAFRMASDRVGNPYVILVPVNAATTRTYTATITTLQSKGNEKVNLYVNGKLAGVITPTAGPDGTAVTSSAISIALTSGLSVIRLEHTSGDEIWVKNIDLN